MEKCFVLFRCYISFHKCSQFVDFRLNLWWRIFFLQQNNGRALQNLLHWIGNIFFDAMIMVLDICLWICLKNQWFHFHCGFEIPINESNVVWTKESEKKKKNSKQYIFISRNNFPIYITDMVAVVLLRQRHWFLMVMVKMLIDDQILYALNDVDDNFAIYHLYVTILLSLPIVEYEQRLV